MGVLDPVPLAPEVDSSALVGLPMAERLLGFYGHWTTVYERSDDEAVEAVRGVIARARPRRHRAHGTGGY